MPKSYSKSHQIKDVLLLLAYAKGVFYAYVMLDNHHFQKTAKKKLFFKKIKIKKIITFLKKKI
jgi:hypothetical protein